MLACVEKQKLMMAFFSIMMVVKLIKVKLMFLLPLLLGVGAAKKLFLKTLLFLFPAFAHIFKFCAFYHAAHTKFHHHHHQVSLVSDFLTLTPTYGARCSVVFKALCYMREGSGFES
jgi:hypothetical protein